MKYLLSILTFFVIGSFSLSQDLTSSLDKKSIFIGEHNTLILDASSIPEEVKWPEQIKLNGLRVDAKQNKKDTIDIEILSQIIDSARRNVMRISFTAWDSGVVTILPVIIDSAKGWSFDPQLIWVKFPDVDPEGDILDIEEGRILLIEDEDKSSLWLIVLAVVGILCLVGGIILYFYYQKHKKSKQLEPEIVLTLRQQAEQRLRELYAKKYWQADKQKIHFIELTDIMRWYVQKRYAIDAMEKTTMELNAAMRMKLIDRSHISVLTELLKQADFVKFAKLTLPEDEVIILNQHALHFVEITEEVETIVNEEE